ncbi:MAG: hypothetical protein M3Y43_05370 [Pseudomonadota bacterium]|nr:hypothetical protein [Pseudomonadota bacterium]MDQ2704570.1 hypothetical protein [Pseudomonadota bacterium]
MRLADFQPLLPAEQDVVARLLSGVVDTLGDGSCPADPDPSRVVRADFLRFLILGGEDGCRPHEKGIRISGGWITGMLDLEACVISRDIGLSNCRFEAVPVLKAAIINRLFLDGSWLPGLQAERMEARGGVYLRAAHVLGEVRILEARLGANLECDGATIRVATGYALNARAIEARSIFTRGSVLTGGIDLSGARLAADFDCTGAEISRPDEVAISAPEIESGGGIILRKAQVDGETRFAASKVEGDFDCTDTILKNPGATALDMSRMEIKGAFFLRGDAEPDGTLILTGASIGTIHDKESCWPKKGDLLLNRCRYGGFIDSPVDANSRLDWLSRQTPGRWGEDFWPQPYEQLASVFREMGHVEDARAVLIVKERLQRRARRSRASNPILRAILFVQDVVLAITVAYGRQPLLAFVWLGLFWALGVAVYSNAESLGALKPNSAVVLRSPEWTLCGVDRSEQRLLSASQQPASGRAEAGQTQLACFREQWEVASYPEFNAWMYSLDTLLPVTELGQKAYWRPDPPKPGGTLAINYFYFQSVIGWALSLLAIAGFSGLVKSP